MKKVLLTGGLGFIGSHIAEKYSELGYTIIIVDNLSSGKIDNIKKIKNNKNVIFVEVDIRNKEDLKEVFEEYRPDIINHHAAQKSVPKSVENPVLDNDINIIGLLNLIELAKEYSIENFIFASSGGALSKLIVGDEKSKESDMPQLFSPYAITKFASESYLKLYAGLYGFKYTILRYANAFGPRQIADGECGVVPIFVNNVVADNKSILMTYDDMPRGCTRDYVYVEDIVEANILATNSSINDLVNIGSGLEVTMLDIYEMINEIYNKNLPIDIIGPREGDIKRSVLDISKAYEKLNWTPKVSLREGLEKIYEYNNI